MVVAAPHMNELRGAQNASEGANLSQKQESDDCGPIQIILRQAGSGAQIASVKVWPQSKVQDLVNLIQDNTYENFMLITMLLGHEVLASEMTFQEAGVHVDTEI